MQYACFLELVIMKYTPRKLINGKMLCLIPVFQLLHQCSLLQNLVTLLCSSLFKITHLTILNASNSFAVDDMQRSLSSCIFSFALHSWASCWLLHARSCQVPRKVGAQLKISGKSWYKSAVYPTSTNVATMGE